jgi:ribonuclease Y
LVLVQRLKDLEEVAYGFSGVKKCIRNSSGWELRVIVEWKKFRMKMLLTYLWYLSKNTNGNDLSGQVKVTVIRETRAVNIAK